MFNGGDGVTALLYQPKSDSLVLVRQFRYPAWVRQGPGWILEETGHEVCNLQHVSTFYLTPGGSSKRIFLYYGEVAVDDRRKPGGGLADENEDIEVVEIAVDRGEIVDAKTLIALMWFRNHRLQT